MTVIDRFRGYLSLSEVEDNSSGILSRQIGIDYRPDITDDVRRFEAKIRREDGHWLWVGAKSNGGMYGQFWYDGQKMGAHVASWLMCRGEIPAGQEICHQCPFKLCVNPDHLSLGTHAENMDEALAARGGVHWNPKGEDHPRARLTWDQVREIRARAAIGEWSSTLGAEFGITQGAAAAIIRGSRWADPAYVPPPSRYLAYRSTPLPRSAPEPGPVAAAL